ncbi:SAVMC3_10250 family protein [Streptomyces phaeochromogenes]|uniref:SAVMC3_10250 family protein n=1 Tax=Streptomyces phaeochromogenes TaxID=1923 RepID=UPI0033D36DE0
MREIVYLSDRKLREFLPEKRRRVPRGKWQLTTPFGGLGLEPEAPDVERERTERLEQIVGHVSLSARWFTEDGLLPGTWVQFEAPLNYRILHGTAHDMVIFFDVRHPMEGYETGGSVRLLLHGSAQHLTEAWDPNGAGRSVPPMLAVRPEPTEPPEPIMMSRQVFRRSLPASGGSVWVTMATSVLTVDHAARLLEILEAEPGVGGDGPQPAGNRRVSLVKGTCKILSVLDREVPAETAAWMRGYARITAVTPAPRFSTSDRYVVGTPLYVEYATD